MQNSSKTYSAQWKDSKAFLFKGLTAQQLFQNMPIGAKIITNDPHSKTKSTFQVGCRILFVIEDSPKS